MPQFGILHFQEQYEERIWGGRTLETFYGKQLPLDKSIGEAWLVSDHPSAESMVDEGPQSGKTLRQILAEDSAAILGTHAKLTPHGRFPLLLKLLDCNDVLSVQVHPDDACAAALGEPDVGKTEMWHVIKAQPGAELICGLKPDATLESLKKAVKENNLEPLLEQFSVREGDSVYVPAGIVHAISPGLLLAEIQQNSDLTYRLYDWGRVGDDGKPRPLHLHKALKAIHYGQPHPGVSPAPKIQSGGVERAIEAASPYFATEFIRLDAGYARDTRNASFHLLLVIKGNVEICSEGTRRLTVPGEAVLVPACAATWTLEGRGEVIDYYVPDLDLDIIHPLKEAGHPDTLINKIVTQ